VGAYRTDQGKPLIFQAVKEAEKRLLEDPTIFKEYLPIDGLASFNKAAKELVFGPLASSDRIVTVQGLSGTGSLRVGAEFMAEHGPGMLFISRPTWPSHPKIF